jgi:hypothetical protein
MTRSKIDAIIVAYLNGDIAEALHREHRRSLYMGDDASRLYWPWLCGL